MLQMHYTYSKTSKYTLSFFSGNLDDRANPMVSLKSAKIMKET